MFKFDAMKKRKVIKMLIIFLVIACNIGCDQVSKSMARTDLPADLPLSFVGHHFTLIRVENTGAFLSLGDHTSGPLRAILLVIIPLLMLGAALYLIIKKRMHLIQLLAICFIVGGGIGNIYDRLAKGSVTDFMHIRVGPFETGIFNMADVSVMVGMFTLVIYNFILRRKQREMEASV